MAIQLNPKILGLNVGIFGTVFKQSGTIFEQSGTEFLGLFSGSLELKFSDCFRVVWDCNFWTIFR